MIAAPVRLDTLYMMQHTSVLRVRRRQKRRRTFAVLVLTLALVGGALAHEDTHCPGLPPSCHIRQEAVCLCAGLSWSTCAWRCIERTREAATP